MPGPTPDKTQEQVVGVVFPMSGVDVTCEFGRQPDATAPQAQNVRTTEAITRRLRGGSRAGLTQYIPATAVGPNLIQHLNILVDPQQPALDAPADDGTFPDFSSNNLSIRNPGRFVRQGGSGAVPNRHVGSTGPSGPTVLQTANANFDGVAFSPYTITFPSQPNSGSLIIVFIQTSNAPGINPVNDPTGVFSVGTIENGASAPYTQVGGTGYSSSTPFRALAFRPTTRLGYAEVVIYQLVSTGSVDDQTITINTPGSLLSEPVQAISVTAFEVMGVQAFSSDNQSSQNDNSYANTVTTGAIALSNLPNEIVFFFAFIGFDPNDSTTPVLTPSPGSWTGLPQSTAVTVIYRTIQATTITPTIASNVALAYAAIGVAYKAT